MISMSSIIEYAGPNLDANKYRGGSGLVAAKHVLTFGKMPDKVEGLTYLKARCMRKTGTLEDPVAITIKLDNELKIVSCHCTCQAGNGEQCKHIIACLIHGYLLHDKIPIISCTDEPCSWKVPQQKLLNDYDAAPLKKHQCASLTLKKNNKSDTTSDNNDILPSKILKVANFNSDYLKNSNKLKDLVTGKEELIKTCLLHDLTNAAISLSAAGRHNMIDPEALVRNNMSDEEKKIIYKLFERQDNKIMELVSQYQCDFILQPCCDSNLNKLKGDGYNICIETKEWYAEWMEQRANRITGSTAYPLYTYSKNKKPDWEKKCASFYTPCSFRTEAMKYGNKTESEAREKFKELNKDVSVIESGLIVSKLNPWLGYSPDGIIVKNGSPESLLEIKCFHNGEKNSIDAVVENQIGKCLQKTGENISMKTKHTYYCQVQVGLAVMNLQKAYFVLYASHDKQLFQIIVLRDEKYLIDVLCTLKTVYYTKLLHYKCLNDKSDMCSTENSL